MISAFATYVEPIAFRCSQCWAIYSEAHIRAHEAREYTVNGQPVCQDCVQMCECGDYICDDATAEHGPGVVYSEWANDGKKAYAHASCAAARLIHLWSEYEFDADSTREEITQACVFGFFNKAAA